MKYLNNMSRSRVDGADAPVLVVVGLVDEAEGVAVVLAAAGETVVVVIEPLPLVLHIVATEVGEIAVVQLRGLRQVAP